MTVLAVSYQVRAEGVPEVEAGIERLMAALAGERPAGLRRYALGTLPDGVTFVGLLELDDGAENPLPALPAARDLQQTVAAWVVDGPPVPQPVRVVGAHGWDA